MRIVLENPIQGPKIWILGDLTLFLRSPKGTNGCRNTLFEPLSITIPPQKTMTSSLIEETDRCTHTLNRSGPNLAH